MTFDELVAAVLSQGGFAVSSSVAGGWVNAKHREAVADAQWMQQSLSLGVTVADQGTYAIPDGVVDIVGLYLADEQGNPGAWSRITPTDLWDVKAGRRGLVGSGGVFAPAFGEAGEKLVELWPAPIADGAEINTLAAMLPPPMASGMSPVIPEDMHEALVDGAIGLGLLRMDERADSAASFEANFQRMVAKLRRRKTSRVGSGVSRMRAYGYDWR